VKGRRVFVFLLIALTVYGLANFYIGRRGAQALAPMPGARTVFLVLFIVLALSFPLGRSLMLIARGRLTSIMIEAGTFHLAVMLYGLMAVLAIDLVRLANAVVPFLPKRWLAEGARTGPVVFAAAAAAVALTLVYGAWNATRLRTVDLEIRLPRRSGRVDRLTVVAASDLHLGELVGQRRLEKVVRQMNDLAPDVVVFAGDIVDESVTEEMEARLGGVMRRLRAPQGIFAALGNHESYSGLARNVACLRACGVTVLQDEAVEVAGALRLVGRRDPSSLATQEVRLSIPGILNRSGTASDLPVVVLDHQPVRLGEVVAAGAEFQISGHTHDGQIFPIGLINSLIYELNWGYLKKGGTQFYVSSGAGTWGPPVRIGSRAEIVRFRFVFDRAP
jgi:predicted MPP superfamily phosphohydrolase